MILSIVTIATTLVTIQVFRTKAWYTAATVIEIGKENSMVLKSEGLTLNDDSDPFYLVNVNTKKLALENPELFEKVVLEQKLEQNPRIIETLQKKSPLSILRAAVSGAEQNKAQTAAKNNLLNEESVRLAPFVEYVQKNASVEQIKNTRALRISYTDEDPILAAQIANSIAAIFMQRSFNSQTEKFTISAEWLDRSTRELKAKVQIAEEALAKYTRDNQIYSTDVGGENKSKTLRTSKLTQLHDQFIRTQTDRMLKKSLYEQVQNGRIAELPEAFSDPKITQFQQQLSALQAQAAELKVKFGPANSKILEVQNQIAVLNEEIAASRDALQAKLNADYERAVEDEQSLGAALASAKAAAVNENQASIKYNILKQDVETARGLYTDFLQKTNQANAQVAEQNNNIKVIQPAKMPYLEVTSLFAASKRIVTAFFLLLFFSTLAYFANGEIDLGDHANGLREAANFFCLFIFFSALAKSEHFSYFHRLFKKFAVLFLAVQIPLATLQFYAFSAGDNVGGSFGAGGSGILTLTIFLLVYYLLENKKNGRIDFNRGKNLFLLSIFFLPIFINETKLSLVLIPVMTAAFFSLKQFKSTLLVIAAGLLILLSFVSFYSDRDVTSDNPMTEIFSRDFLETYLAEDNEELNTDIPRVTKINRSLTLLAQDYSSLILGLDYSAFKGGTTVGLSAFDTKYKWLLQGSRPYLFYLLMMGGLSLAILVVYLFFGEVVAKPSAGFQNYSPRLLIFVAAIFLLVLFYNDAFRNQAFLIIFTSVLFFSKYYKSSDKLR